MKKLLAFAIGAALSLSAVAGPATSLPAGPIYLKFTGQEQVATGAATTWTDATHSGEINWGVFTVQSMSSGVVNTPHDSIDPLSIFFADIGHGQITGMFYDVKKGGASPTNAFPGTGGFIDLYWRDLDAGMTHTVTAGLNPATLRTDWNHATGFTEGTFLGRLKFDTGMDLGNSSNTIVGDTTPIFGGFKGSADSYASVDTSAGGLWASQLDSNWFASSQGFRDLRFKTSYNYNSSWNGANPNILGARIDDPGQAVALPEPGALSLMGLTLAGMGAVLRRRQKKEKA